MPKPKMTAKYSTALVVARREKMGANVNAASEQEGLYSRLQEIGYYWNSDRKEWEHHAIDDADDPTPLIMIRVWANAEIVEDVAEDVIRRVPKNWGKPIKKNGPYVCRPPKQREARMYLEFMPTKEKSHAE